MVSPPPMGPPAALHRVAVGAVLGGDSLAAVQVQQVVQGWVCIQPAESTTLYEPIHSSYVAAYGSHHPRAVEMASHLCNKSVAGAAAVSANIPRAD
jgi:hypothetical protein